MSEDAELQRKIDRLTQRISEAKEAESRKQFRAPTSSNNWSTRPYAGTPYGVYRGRGRGAHSVGAPHRNRTLVVSNRAQNATTTSPANQSGQQSGWVTKHDRHMQLINTSVLDQKTKQRAMAMEETRKQRLVAREEAEKRALMGHVQSDPNRQIVINDITFRVADGGSKLIKDLGAANAVKTTPKQVIVAGISFIRSTHGNLYRAGYVKTKRSGGKAQSKRSLEPCPQFSNTGTCSKGPLCKYTHDASKVAICRELLTTGMCPDGEACDLSHELTPERVPVCLHFQRANCTNENCRYTHTKINPGAPICRPFAVLGYCSAGSSCQERHIRECPDYANKGTCRNKKCRLPHVDHAGQLRKNASKTASDADDNSSDLASDDEEVEGFSSDVDSDVMEEIEVDINDKQLSSQADFVKL